MFCGVHKMEKIIHNVQTQEVISVPLTTAEIAEITTRQAEADKLQAELEQAHAAKVAEKTALLERLGITQEEAALLLGGN
jgi:predicted Ser/Thr protein kinase